MCFFLAVFSDLTYTHTPSIGRKRLLHLSATALFFSLEIELNINSCRFQGVCDLNIGAQIIPIVVLIVHFYLICKVRIAEQLFDVSHTAVNAVKIEIILADFKVSCDLVIEFFVDDRT